MAKQTKATKSTSVDESSTTTISTPVPQVIETAAVKKAPRVKKEKTVATVETATVPEPVVVEEAVVSEVVADLEVSLTVKTGDFFQKLQQLSVAISALKTEYRTLEKQWTRELKQSLKSSSKRKRKNGNRAPSGFVKPTKISDELAKFLDKPSGSEMARTEVTRDINQYIRANSLQDKTNGRRIIPDVKLSNLLKIKKGEELTYFNLQRYMSCHFAKSVKAEAAAAAAASQSSTA